MKHYKHLLLWSSAGCLALLMTAAIKENFFKEWRLIQRSARAANSPIDVHLRQVVVPGMTVSDRCVSCHVGMSPGESELSGPAIVMAHKPVVHDPADYGCTVCHAGQGRATESADAHGDVHFWPSPMIPRRFAYAGCGSCHTYLNIPNQEAFQRGRNAFEQADCLACHKLEGRGGTARVGGVGGMEGPDLSTVGATGYDTTWYTGHLTRRDSTKAALWMNSFGSLDRQTRHDLDVFLSSRVGAPGLVEAKAAFHSLGCRGCHKVNGVGGDDGPDLSLIGEKDPGRLDFSSVTGERSFAGWLAEHFRAPAKLVPGSQMPELGLNEVEIDELVYHMLSLRRPALPDAYWTTDRLRAMRFGEREFATDGATLYGTFCAACHGRRGEGMRYAGMAAFPAIGNPDFLSVASDEFITETVRRGRPGRRMPAWGEKEGGLRSAEVAAVVDYLRSSSGVRAPADDGKPRRWVSADATMGAHLYVAHCASCHGVNGQGAEGPALNNPVLLQSASDTYLLTTIMNGRRNTSMSGFLTAATSHPALTPYEIETIVSHIRTWEQPL
ncbi:MAG: c-type cytochrome [Candidatus Zixiibacteriota bacterium]